MLAALTFGLLTSVTAVHAAEMTKPVISVTEIDVKDEAAYKEALPAIQKRIAEHSGKYLAGGFNKTNTIKGAPPPNRVVIIEYDSQDAFNNWWKEAGDADVKTLEKFATFRIYTIEAVEKK